MNPRFPLRKIHLLIFLSFIVGVLWASSSGYAFKNPNIELKQVRIIGLDQSAVALEGVLEIFNPNDMGSRFSGYQYQLDVEGQRLMTGESDRSFEIPAQKTVSITIPAAVQLNDLLTLGKKNLLNKDLIYVISGTAFLDSWLGKIPLPFSYQDTFNLSDLLREKTRQFLQDF
ncbi:MAG: LEA type 2 family protein [Thermodesulfobacteriota bacterium]|jgi:LEA14-like dessication related protein